MCPINCSWNGYIRVGDDIVRRSSKGRALCEALRGNVTVKKTKKPAKVCDEDGFRRRAGCVVFDSQNENKVLLVSSAKSNSWVIPAGKMEPGETDKEAAERETLEEAGAIGHINRLAGHFQNCVSGWRLGLFVMHVDQLASYPQWHEGQTRERRWFTIEDALEVLSLKSAYQPSLLLHALGAKVTIT